MPDVPVRSVRKALEMLDILVFEDPERGGKTLSELAGRMGAPLNTAHNLLKSMTACGYAARTPEGRYVAGHKCDQIGRWNRLRSPESYKILGHGLNTLCAELGETVVFSALVDGAWVSLARRDSHLPIRVAPVTTHPDNIYTTATGRTLCAFASSEERARVLARHGPPGKRWDGLRSKAAFVRACERIRRAGGCVIRQAHHGTVMLACPVLAPGGKADAGGGRLLGALGCAAPLFRSRGSRPQALLRALKRAAADLARQLAATPGSPGGTRQGKAPARRRRVAAAAR